MCVCSVWVGNKVAKMYSMQKSRWYSAAFALRQRMLNFVQNFEYYMMFEVIEPNWHLFQLNMDTVGGLIGNYFSVGVQCVVWLEITSQWGYSMWFGNYFPAGFDWKSGYS